MLKGRRIIFVLGNLELGGAERQALILARHLSEHAEANVEIWGFNKSGPVAEICEQQDIPSRVVPYPFTEPRHARLRGLVRVCRNLSQAKPDLLLPYTFGPNVVCGLVWKWTGASCCVWNQRDEGIVPYGSPSVRWAAQRTPQFISNSVAGAQFLVDKLGVTGEKVTVIPNGIEPVAPQLDRRAWRAHLAIDDRSFVACMVANMHANKDHATLLHAWRRVVNELNVNGRRAVLVLAGRQDDAYPSVASLATELDLNDTIRFTGPVSDVSGLLHASDVGVFSSRSEGCPNAVLESMAAGLPVAGTDIQGIREVVGAAGVPLLAPAGDADSLAAVLIKLAGDPEHCARIGAENRLRIRDSYDSQRMCRETTELLANIYSENERCPISSNASSLSY